MARRRFRLKSSSWSGGDPLVILRSEATHTPCHPERSEGYAVLHGFIAGSRKQKRIKTENRKGHDKTTYLLDRATPVVPDVSVSIRSRCE